MLSKAELHKQIDDEFSPMVDALKGSQENFWAVCEVFRMWRIEKQYVEQHGCRIPEITNIQVPSSRF